jgi:hypothetical protein
MNAWQRMFCEEEAEIAFFLQEEFREELNGMQSTNFVKIGKRVVNLARVQTVHYNPQGGLNYDSPCVEIDFGGAENAISIFAKYELEAYKALMTWMDEQAPLLSKEVNNER